MTVANHLSVERKDQSSSALRIHISCASSFDNSSSRQQWHQHHHHHHRSGSAKSIAKANSGGSGSNSPPSPILATNFQAVHPSAKYHPLARHAQKPLSTYTALGTPIPRRVIIGGGGGQRPRSVSLGSITCLANNTTISHYRSNSPNDTTTNNNNNAMSEPAPPEVPTPPRLAARRQAEAAERSRALALEQDEVQCNADELRMILKKERLRMEHIQAELTELRSGVAQEQLQAEVLEEECINGLVLRLDHLHEEKARIVVEEREQEMIANALRKRLETLSRQRRDLEAQVAAEETKTRALKIRIHHHHTTTTEDLSSSSPSGKEHNCDNEDNMEEG